MDADKPSTSSPKRSINVGRSEFEISRVRYAAEKARKIAESDALSRIQPGDNLIAFPTRP